MNNDLIEIFEDTQRLYKSHNVLKQVCSCTRANEKLYFAEDSLICNYKIYEEKCKITVSKKRSFEAASSYEGMKTVVLNFANSFNPGGGVVHGARAQEECLCRCSTLYYSLNTDFMMENFYERHIAADDELATDDVIYSPAVKVFKSDTDFPQLLPEIEWFDVDVITCAAPNIYVGWNEKLDISNEALSNIHEKRLRRILDIAVTNGAEVVILGAFGCGAFGNPPEIVANVAKTVLNVYEYAFKTVEFAVYCSPKDIQNYEVFHKVLNR